MSARKAKSRSEKMGSEKGWDGNDRKDDEGRVRVKTSVIGISRWRGLCSVLLVFGVKVGVTALDVADCELVKLLFLGVEVAEAEPEADASEESEDGHRAVVPDKKRVGGKSWTRG